MRELNIINDLIESKDYLPIEYFISKYSVSKRTLQNEFSYISCISKNNGFNLIQKRGRGYLIEIKDSEIFNKYISTLSVISDVPQLSSENIVAYIAVNNGYTTTESLINLLGVSKTTIKGYDKDVSKYLQNYGLELEKKAHYGMRIKGDILKRKKILIKLYSDNNDIVKKVIDEMLGDDFKKIHNCLIDTLKDNKVIINYFELTDLLNWLKVTVYINKNLNTEKNKDCKTNLIKTINDVFDIGMGEEEIKEWDKLIIVKTRDNNNCQKYLSIVKKDVEEFLIKIDEENNTSFNQDEEFKALLFTHVASLINRLSFKVSYTNPMVDEISIKYPMIFNIAIALGNVLKEKYDVEVNKDEIGFLATYFILHMEKEIVYKLKNYKKIAIVCSSGGGSAYLIKLKLKNLFISSDIETFSILHMKELEEYKPDVIFSITPLSKNLDAPVIYIKELLDDYDILNIKQLVMFERFEGISVKESNQYFLQRFFNQKYFSIQDGNFEYIECLKEMSKKLEEDGIGGFKYSENVLKREEFSPTIYINGIAIPHPIEMNAETDMISVRIFKNPIKYKNKNVSIIFMVALTKKSLELHKGITNNLFEVMNNLELVQALTKVKSLKEFLALINK